MGSTVNPIMSEKLSAVLRQWDSEPQNHEPPPQYTKQPELFNGQPASEPAKVFTESMPERIANIIKQKPGITGTEIRNLVLSKEPDMYPGNVSATLKALFDRKMVVRIPVKSNSNRSSFAYSWVESPPVRKRKRRRVKAKDSGITTLLPQVAAPVENLIPVTPAPAPLALGSGITINVGSYVLSLREAHTLYEQLAELFGKN